MVVSLLGLVIGAQGCAGAGLALLGVGAGTAAGTGTSYTLDGIAYRTFTASLDEMRRATATSLKRMDIRVKTDQPTDSARSIVASAGERTVAIELQKLTGRTTRMRVTVKQNAVFRDRATAGEIIAQTERTLDDLPALSQRALGGTTTRSVEVIHDTVDHHDRRRLFTVGGCPSRRPVLPRLREVRTPVLTG
jgi:hypothetical protein